MIDEPYVSELVILYHDAKPVVGKRGPARKVWAANEFHKAHPEIAAAQAYRRLGKALGQKGL